MASPAPDASQLKDGILFKDVTKRTLLALEQLLAESLKPTSTYENYILVPKTEYQKLVALSDKSVKKCPGRETANPLRFSTSGQQGEILLV